MAQDVAGEHGETLLDLYDRAMPQVCDDVGWGVDCVTPGGVAFSLSVPAAGY